MTVNIIYEPQTANTDEYIHYAQIISNAFSKALEDNECSVKLLIGFREEIVNKKEELATVATLDLNPKAVPGLDPSYYTNPFQGSSTPITNQLGTDQFVLNTLTKSLMESCFNCRLRFPKLSVKGNINFAFDGLKFSLDTFTAIFKNIQNPNVCHVAGVFSFSCVPSILSLLMLFVSSYSTVLALQKINNISLQAFIKGIISGLISKLTANLAAKLDTSNTGVVCLIDAIREIAIQLEEQQKELTDLSTDEILARLGFIDPVNNDVDTETIPDYKPLNNSKPQYILEQDRVIGEFYSNATVYKNSIVDKYINQIVLENSKINNSISSAFIEISNIVDDVVTHLNESLDQLFGLIDFFQCETERSGGNFSEILSYANRLVSLINLLSSIFGIVLRRIYAPLCKLVTSVSELSTVINPETIKVGDPLTELEQIEIISEFLGKAVEITTDGNGNITPIIYDKDVPTLLPKLSLTNCNLKDFIAAHSIDNVIKKIFEETKQEQERSINTESGSNSVNIYKGVILPQDNIVDKNKWIVYPIKYEVPALSKTTTTDNVTLEAIRKTFTDTFGAASSIKSILELVYDNPLSKTTDLNTGDTKPQSGINKPPSSYTDKEFKESLYSPTPLTESEQKTFQNKCKDINDVLNVLEGILK